MLCVRLLLRSNRDRLLRGGVFQDPPLLGAPAAPGSLRASPSPRARLLRRGSLRALPPPWVCLLFWREGRLGALARARLLYGGLGSCFHWACLLRRNPFRVPSLSPGAPAAWVCVLRLLRYVRSHGIAYDTVRCFARAARPGVCLRIFGDRALLLRFRCFCCCPRPRVLFSVLASVRVPALPALVWRRCDVSRETLRGLRETHGECFT